MPLRDHFRPPVWKHASWEGFNGMLPGVFIQSLDHVLPSEYSAEPRVRLGHFCEIGEFANDKDDVPKKLRSATSAEPGGIATATSAPPEPTLTVEVDLTDQYEYEVLVYDQSRARQLVAAVEIVSPANKDRAENRRAFVTKCAALLQQGVCVSMVDLVTTRSFNLYADLLSLLDRWDPAFTPKPSPVYAITCRCRKVGQTSRLESWAYPLAVGKPLPKLPIWLADHLNVMLDLEASYEEACRVLRIP